MLMYVSCLRCSIRLFKSGKYHILTVELYHLVKLFEEKFQAVCNKMALYPITDELKNFKVLIS